MKVRFRFDKYKNNDKLFIRKISDKHLLDHEVDN